MYLGILAQHEYYSAFERLPDSLFQVGWLMATVILEHNGRRSRTGPQTSGASFLLF
jgi:hypothetical protein